MSSKTPPPSDSGESSPRYTGHVIVGLSEEAAAREHEARAGGAKELSEINQLLRKSQLPGLTPVITSTPPETVAALEREARKGPLPPLRSMNTLFRVDSLGSAEFPETLSQAETHAAAETLAAALSDHPDVEIAYPEMTPHDPASSADDDPFCGLQTYLDPAPKGIDARWIWTQPHGRGEGVGIADVEEAWNLAHEDLVAKGARVVCGDNRHDSQDHTGDHGTKVLGVLVAQDNQVGMVGIATGITRVAVASRFQAKTRTVANVADAIVAATAALKRGDILLVEVERGVPGLPTEVEAADFHAIRLAAGVGRVVVEAAGNGGMDLDAFLRGQETIFKRGSAAFQESGAIMVGAAGAAPPHDPAGSNHGSRIDCYAHGTLVATCGGGDLTPNESDPNKRYTGNFNGTSAASAIIAGAAILVQGRHKHLNGKPLLPLKMRTILANPETGTPPGSGKLGVMPNLRAITDAHVTLRVKRRRRQAHASGN